MPLKTWKDLSLGYRTGVLFVFFPLNLLFSRESAASEYLDESPAAVLLVACERETETLKFIVACCAIFYTNVKISITSGGF